MANKRKTTIYEQRRVLVEVCQWCEPPGSGIWSDGSTCLNCKGQGGKWQTKLVKVRVVEEE